MYLSVGAIPLFWQIVTKFAYVVYPAQARTHQLGGKIGALANLHRTGLLIPAWFALAPEAFYAGLSHKQRQVLAASTDSAGLLTLLQDLELSPAVQAELDHALAELCPNGELVAVRSSALDEDGTQHSFAGQLDSFLCVLPSEAAEKVVAVWRSGFSERILAYCREHSLSLVPQAPAVLVQRMVKADMSGVAFSADPISGRRGVTVIGALYGLGTALVSGEANADTYHVDRQGQIIARTIVAKQIAHRYANGRTSAAGHAPDLQTDTIVAFPVPEAQANQPTLSDPQVQAVSQLARQAERFFGRPQDIEWALEGEQIYLLQSRPITSLAHLSDPDGILNLWDNSNIAESYPGITTPLTFSFARRAYEEVYRQFCRMMGVPAATIMVNSDIFPRMLGLIRGRIYYNLLNWYRLLALLPGYTVNRRFMEQMMGVKECLPDSLLADSPPPTRSARLWDALHLLRTVTGLMVNYFRLPRRIAQFYSRLTQALDTERPDLAQLRADELLAYYRSLERQLLARWDAPLVNDFFAMVFYGLLRRLAEKWCGDHHGTLQNGLLSSQGGLISAEPPARLREMAQTAARQPHLVAALSEGSLEQIFDAMRQVPEFGAKYRDYLHKFGDRCLEELKLESATLHDDPLILLRSVGHLARRVESGPVALAHPDETASPQASLRRQAEQRVRQALAGQPLRRVVFKWVLQNARHRVRDRENLRFERTRLFGRARAIFVELGRRLHVLDLLADARDVFYLEVEEVLGFIEGTTTTTDLRGLVALRRAEFERYRTMELPAGRFETRGLVHQGNSFQTRGVVVETMGDQRQGLGCCPGIVRGCVRVVTDPRNVTLQPGEILVAERTDPGWIMLFPAAAGLLVEHGSLLSHSAIVARELGLPAIISLAGVTGWLKNGDWVELDGSTGVVKKLLPSRVGTLAERNLR
ncbi:MAG: phosphoenolpyruvate synthase [Chloroflexi bacterium]|nr:phosphoenolpyruvate synthase [Chloroflexota bacterium]